MHSNDGGAGELVFKVVHRRSAFVWGCAPWENNNGPNYPYYKKTKITIPKGQAQVFNQNGARW